MLANDSELCYFIIPVSGTVLPDIRPLDAVGGDGIRLTVLHLNIKAVNGKITQSESAETGGHRLQAPSMSGVWFARELRPIPGVQGA